MKRNPVPQIELPAEFKLIDRPHFNYNVAINQHTLLPWNYNLKRNESKKYPLVIYLHGFGGANKIEHLNFLGYQSLDIAIDRTSLNFQIATPCFVLVPQTNTGWDNNLLINQVETFKKKYRVDTSRIYLIGYSMGGSGAYSFANAYNNYNGHLFAGIIRLAGQSQVELNSEIVKNTSIWLHVGLKDTRLRIDIARAAYTFLKENCENAVESVTKIKTKHYSASEHTLTIKASEQFKLTEYKRVGHEINTLPFTNSELMNWLLKKTLKKRP